MKTGDSVKVKDGTKEPDTEDFEIGGWQGRIVEIDKKADLRDNKADVKKTQAVLSEKYSPADGTAP